MTDHVENSYFKGTLSNYFFFIKTRRLREEMKEWAECYKNEGAGFILGSKTGSRD